MSEKSAEQEARDLLERLGIEDAQSFSAGELVELANLIAEVKDHRAHRLGKFNQDTGKWNPYDFTPDPDAWEKLERSNPGSSDFHH